MGLLIYLLLKEVRNPKLGLWVSQSLDGVTSQKYMTVISHKVIDIGLILTSYILLTLTVVLQF